MRFLFRKVFVSVLILFGVILLVFMLFQGLGDPARMVMGQSGNRTTLQQIRNDLNIDKPKWKQFLYYVNDVSPLSIYEDSTLQAKGINGFRVGKETKWVLKYPYLGVSYQGRKKVTDLLLEALPGTLLLAFAAMLFACTVGIILGILAALYKGTWIDQKAMFGSIVGISAPSFFMALLVAYLFGIVWHDFTGLNISGSLYALDEVSGKKILQIQNLILPAFTLGIRPLAIITQLTRTSMLDVIHQDYIRTAYAKGLGKKTVLFSHALPNAINPVVTAISGWMAELLAGSFFIEYIFGWKGLGKLTVDALEKLDYPVVMGAILLSATLFIFINFLSDFIYRFFDPRIK